MVDYPVRVTVDYPEKLSRLHLLVKVFLGWIYVGLPHGIALWVYGIGVGIVQLIAFFVILFTGKYPRGMFGLVADFMRWQTRATL